MVVFLALTTPAQSAERVCVYVNSNAVPPDVIIFAADLSSRMFAKAGVVVEFRFADRHTRDKVRASGAIIINLEMYAPADTDPATMAHALPYEGVHIVIFYDRVRRHDNQTPLYRSTILGHVMTHEITHILQGTPHHSATGLMKARWGTADYMEMTRSPLPFTAKDIELLRAGLQHREMLAQCSKGSERY
jgi:hypothetical protein